MFDQNRYQYNNLFRKGIRSSLKSVGKRHAERLKLVAGIDSTDKAVSVYNELRSQSNNISNRFRYASDRERALVGELLNSLTASSAPYPIAKN